MNFISLKEIMSCQGGRDTSEDDNKRLIYKKEQL